MRLSVIASLGSMIFHGEAGPSSSTRNLVRPHNRFMIQAVSESRQQSFSEYKFALVKQGKYCQAASSLMTADKQESLPLFGASSEITQRGAISTRKYLHSLGDEMRKEDLRRAVEMKYIWDKSIVLEVGEIKKAVESNLDFHGKQAEFANKLHVAAKAHAKDIAGQYESHLFMDNEQKVFRSAESTIYDLKSKHDASVVKNPKNHLNGVLSHSLEDWWSIKNHHGKSKEELEFLSGILSELEKGIKVLFDQQLEDIETGKDYILKWGPGVNMEEVEKYSHGTRLNDVASKEEKSIGTTDYQISDNGKAFDSFGPDRADQLGSKIVELLAKPIVSDPPKGEEAKFQDFLDLEGSPAETMDRLTTLLNALQMQRLGLFDARHSLDKLRGKIIDVGVENQKNLLTSKTVMEVDLSNIDPLAKVVYEDLERYPTNKDYGVKLEDEANKDAYDTYKKNVNTAKGQNAIQEVHPRINLLANVARRVHGHMLGFLGVLGNPDSEGSKTFLNLFVPSGSPKDSFSVEEKRTIMEKARSASNCLLYGRYDVLMRYLKLVFNQVAEGPDVSEEGWCGKLHAEGLTLLARIDGSRSGEHIGVKAKSNERKGIYSARFREEYLAQTKKAFEDEFAEMQAENVAAQAVEV